MNQTKTEAIFCAGCKTPSPVFPLYAGRARYCAACWEMELEKVRGDIESVRVTRKHKNALAEEHVLEKDESPIGRLILFRDSLTLCVRFLTTPTPLSLPLLDQTLRTLLGSWPHDYLDVEIISATLPSRDGSTKKEEEAA